MESKTDRLWAKSRQPDETLSSSMFLAGHLKDVYEAAKRVLDATGADQLRALGLETKIFGERLRQCVLLAAAIHDIGKANDHFQGMITRRRNVQLNPQGLRHEWATILMLKSLKEWLLPAVGGREIDWAIVEWAVAGHHPAHNHASPPTDCPPGAGADIEFWTDQKDFGEILDWLAEPEMFNLSHPDGRRKSPLQRRPLAGSGDVFGELATWAKAGRRTWEGTVRKSADAKFVAAVKNCLIAADVAGSALAKARPEDPAAWDWVTESLENKPEPGDLQKVADRRLGGSTPWGFQTSVAESEESVTFVKAGCGSGKTVAAYMWAARNHPTRRLYFCYPTTGTATEGFKDYLFEPDGELGDLGARLFHSRRDIDFEIILTTGPDSKSQDADGAAMLESLEAWSTPVVACTVDTVLGIVQNNKRGLFAWPALSQSAFVFDEIHSFDDRLFGALLRFLRDLPGLPVLLMTASLPMARETALRDMLKKYRGISLNPIGGPPELERLPRYHKATVQDNDPLPLVENTLSDGGKILWVCNTVARAMAAAERAKARGLEPFIYHSRFKYRDRVRRHKEVLAAFTTENSGAALAICSQVAEMSLDLKGCTLLVSDTAPVPSLIQRLGRLNRQAADGDPTRPFVIVEPDNHLPYASPELEATRVWLGKLSDAAISQRELADKWEQVGDHAPGVVASAWLDGGPVTSVSELREVSPGITVVMDEPETPDLQAVLRYEARIRQVRRDARQQGRSPTGREFTLRAGEARLTSVTLPMPSPPRRMNWRSWRKHKGIPVAEAGAIIYDSERGAEWRK